MNNFRIDVKIGGKNEKDLDTNLEREKLENLEIVKDLKSCELDQIKIDKENNLEIEKQNLHNLKEKCKNLELEQEKFFQENFGKDLSFKVMFENLGYKSLVSKNMLWKIMIMHTQIIEKELIIAELEGKINQYDDICKCQ